MDSQQPKRSAFSGKIGFVLSAAGASVGLGNIWRFPVMVSKYGGMTFLIPFFFFFNSYIFLSKSKLQPAS